MPAKNTAHLRCVPVQVINYRTYQLVQECAFFLTMHVQPVRSMIDIRLLITATQSLHIGIDFPGGELTRNALQEQIYGIEVKPALLIVPVELKTIRCVSLVLFT